MTAVEVIGLTAIVVLAALALWSGFQLWNVQRKALKPLSDLARAASQMVEADAEQQLPAMGLPDVVNLAQSLQKLGQQKQSTRLVLEQAELQTSKLAYVARHTDNGVAILDKHARIEWVNEAFSRFTEFSLEEAIGKYPGEIMPSTDRELAVVIRDRLRHGEGYHGSLDFRAKSGTYYWIVLDIEPVRDEDGGLLYFVAMGFNVTDLKASELKLRDANEQLQARIVELEQRNLEISLLSEFGELLQSCATVDQAFQVVERFGVRLFPFSRGNIAMINPSRTAVERVARWGKGAIGEPVFPPDQCCALLRGRPFQDDGSGDAIRCPQMAQVKDAVYFCIPLVAHGEAIGVMQITWENQASIEPARRSLAMTLAEHTALGLANQILRDTLRGQTIRDPLTGLYNRRYLEETLDREILRAMRSESPVAILIMDLDHFKQFNDFFGHDGGDALLRRFGELINTSFRGSDVGCRLGGEEFAVILPETTMDAALQRAEQFRESVRNLTVDHRGRIMAMVTVSIGVAITPEHGKTSADLMHLADKALYRAKAQGRDRVVVASSAVLDEGGLTPAAS